MGVRGVTSTEWVRIVSRLAQVVLDGICLRFDAPPMRVQVTCRSLAHALVSQ